MKNILYSVQFDEKKLIIASNLSAIFDFENKDNG